MIPKIYSPHFDGLIICLNFLSQLLFPTDSFIFSSSIVPAIAFAFRPFSTSFPLLEISVTSIILLCL